MHDPCITFHYFKFARPLGPRRVRSYAFVVSNILNIMNSLNLINLLINRARTRAALGTPFSKRTPPPRTAPRRTSIHFLATRGGFENRSIFGPLKIDPVGGKVAPWPPFGRQWFQFTYYRASFGLQFGTHFQSYF